MSDRQSGWLLVAAQLVLIAVIVIAPTSGRWTLPSTARVAAQAMATAGIAIIIIGALQLGRGASVHPQPTAAATLRTGGLYRFARHPIYTGVLLFATGTALHSGSAVSAVAAALLLPVLIVKTSLEERLLRSHFPHYTAYSQTTGRFTPRRRPR